jgi:DNA-binding NarL/FixJ family response regulator
MNVLLVDDHRLLLEGLSNLLAAQGIQVAGVAHDGLEAIEQARALKPDVILMDIRMPNCDGLCATRRIIAEMPEMKIVILTTSSDDQDLFEAIRSGAYGYLLKSMDADELVECLEQARQGIPPFSPGLAARLLSEFARLAQPVAEAPKVSSASSPEPNPADKLTARQRQVLALVAQGNSYKETAQKLGLSPRTIKYHMTEIMAQLHLEHRAEVLAYAGRFGLDN